ncbi:RNA polymerase sigma-I factor [Sporosarcina highlanderae]|uniref:RNA polymerase sigma factor SigI n=1 Tax=Sporosarcina highlanderae TaxID=3035916 RepID=A0ABT8JUJ3_9BACL|nr:RNA polymerase sigma-I factor [Sporosarcina highlanderae]MDN4608527.1 RNA polymerase sigma-I factor [Sporosarcina highlanderae]
MLLSIIQGIFNKKSNTALIELVCKAKSGDEKVMNDLLIAFTPFMKKTASFVCNRFIDDSDEEFSVAMVGFHEAVLKYEPEENASLKTFAHLIMKRRLIDHIRKEAVRNANVLLSIDNDGDSNTSEYIFDETSIFSYSEERQAAERREEMTEYGRLLREYGLSFRELATVSPKHADSRKTAFQIAQIIAETPEFYKHLLENKRLPMKQLEDIVEVSRKTIERHRKYIIAVTLLLNHDFKYIQEYVKGELI